MPDKIETADSPKGDEVTPEIVEGDDLDALKDKYQKLSDTNKRLYERAKKHEGARKHLEAEGYDYQEGKWIKDKVAPEIKPEAKADTKLLERLEKLALGQAGITHQEDIELARNTAKKWNMEIDEVLADDDFKAKLERQQTNRANLDATNVRGGSNSSVQAKSKPEYWIAKGVPPTPEDLPDRKARAKIIRAMMDKAKTSGKTYYSE